ncbi:polysaccharide biosynthesis protein [Candidatus Koribacter versatilis Ellin345]|uniref:Polysaccharide biosynthesis protein n=2 Tax=Candidatus Korobacter versatilis TaxID=658062 RepID=Q1ING3_KORVE|nr:polysaccharide biosynthesis protein [Candidatus Koribacter versatilis Ellin345]
MIGSRTARTLVTALYFILLARSLGSDGYGAFTAACAIIGIVSPFASLGTGNVLVQYVARNREEFPVRWGHCLLVTLISGVLLTAVVLVIVPLALTHGVPLPLIACIAIAELIFARLLDAAAMAFQAFERLAVTGWIILALSVSRLLAASLLLHTRHATAVHWSVLYLASTVVPAVIALCYVARELGAPRFGRWTTPRDLLTGLYFSVSQAAQTVYNDIDKAMLARLSGLAAAGIYAAAYRIIDAAFSPVLSVLAATYAGFFRHGQQGLQSSSAFARRIMPRTFLYSLFAASLLWVAAPYLPFIIGPQFNDSVWVLRWLSPLLVLRNLHYLAADSLTGAGYQSTRTLLQLLVAALNIGLNIALLPRYSWRGAVWTSLASDGVIALAMWIALWYLRAREVKRCNVLSPEWVEA